MGADTSPFATNSLKRTPGPRALAIAQPADARRQALEGHALLRPSASQRLQSLVVGEQLAPRRDRWPGCRPDRPTSASPAERALALAEQRAARTPARSPGYAKARRAPARPARRPRGGCCRSRTRRRRAPAWRTIASTCSRHRVASPSHVLLGVGAAQRRRLLQRHPGRHVAAQRVVRAGLIGHDVGAPAAPDQLRQHLGAVADQPDGQRLAGSPRAPRDPRERRLERVGLAVAGSASSRGARCAPDRPRRRARRRRSSSRPAAARRPCHPGPPSA